MYKQRKGKYLLIALVVLVLAGVAVYVFQQKKEEPVTTLPQEIIDSKEQQFIRNTSAPPGATSRLQGKEREQVIKSTSGSPDAQSGLTDEEQIKILESTSAPNK